MSRLQAESAVAMQRLIDRAQSEGVLRTDVTSGDIGLLLVRLGRPYVSPFPHDLDERLAHRQLDLLLDGLRNAPHHPVASLPEPAMTLADLMALSSAGPLAREAGSGARARRSRSIGAHAGREREPMINVHHG